MIGVFFGADAPKKRVGFETSAVAVRAGRIAAIAGEHDTDVHLVGFRFEPFEEMLNAVPLLRAEACPFRIAEADPVLFFLSQITVRLADIQTSFGGITQEVVLAFGVAFRIPGFDGTFFNGEAFVGNDQTIVHADDSSEPAAGVA